MSHKEKILIGMSGGVDSSVAALLLSREYETVGATMKLIANTDEEPPQSGKICCTADDAFDAKAVCFKLGIPHYVFNFTREFEDSVIADFAENYQNGKTPNPCIVCNKALKFGKLLLRAREIGCGGVATGHYARLETTGGRTVLKKARDIKKDQSYFLYSLTGEQLSKSVFPLGGLTKNEVREIADKNGLVTAKKAESQDICFVRDGDYAAFLVRHGVASPEGDFVDKNGGVIGRHKGIIHYTKGQRKGLGAFGSPKYVTGIDSVSNRVILGDLEDLFTKTVTIKNINLTAADRLDTPIKCRAKIRYNQTEQPCTAGQTDDDTIIITFDEPQKSATPGQAAVLYDGETVIGGGIII